MRKRLPLGIYSRPWSGRKRVDRIGVERRIGEGVRWTEKGVQDLCLKMSEDQACLWQIRFGQEGRRSGRDSVDRIGVEREGSEKGFARRLSDRADRLCRLVPHLSWLNQLLAND